MNINHKLTKITIVKRKNPLNCKVRGSLIEFDFYVVSGWQDSNLRPPAPKAGAIPGYATPRTGIIFLPLSEDCKNADYFGKT